MQTHSASSGDRGIDITQFHAVFFEEADEHLRNMESLLLEIDLAAPDAEAVNAVFRAAHSIKGGSGMFGFDDVTDLTHEVETLLDRVRKGQLPLTVEIVDVMAEITAASREQGSGIEQVNQAVAQMDRVTQHNAALVEQAAAAAESMAGQALGLSKTVSVFRTGAANSSARLAGPVKAKVTARGKPPLYSDAKRVAIPARARQLVAAATSADEWEEF